MRFYIKNRAGAVDAMAEYDEEKKTFTVLKGSRVSDHISNAPTFRGIESIKKLRNEYVTDDGFVNMNVTFKSPSTAANFVRGTSTDGCRAWKDDNGHTFKEIFGGKKK